MNPENTNTPLRCFVEREGENKTIKQKQFSANAHFHGLVYVYVCMCVGVGVGSYDALRSAVRRDRVTGDGVAMVMGACGSQVSHWPPMVHWMKGRGCSAKRTRKYR